MMIPFYKLFFIFSLVSLAAALPITFVGLGTREYVMINLLMLFGVEREKALAISLITYLFLVVNLVVSSFFWTLEHKKD